jgi:hypothetical protein
MPILHQLVVVFFYYLMYAIDFSSCESAAALQSDGNEPKFCHIFVSLDMDMLRLVSVTSVPYHE